MNLVSENTCFVKVLSVIFFSFTLHNIATAQLADSLKCWDKSSPLSWSDFRGKVPPSELSSNVAAQCPHRISPYQRFHKGKVFYEIGLYFLRNKAWHKDTLGATLRHEQIHFDIAELYVRRLRQKLSHIQKRYPGDNVRFIKAIKQGQAEEIKAQIDFDYVAGSEQPAPTAQWRKKIDVQLKQLKKYASSESKCVL